MARRESCVGKNARRRQYINGMILKVQWMFTSQEFHMLMVLRPPMRISEVYSSRARLLSPTAGMYLNERVDVSRGVQSGEVD